VSLLLDPKLAILSPLVARDSFPRQNARTRRFSLGAPRSFAVAEDGSRVAFIRSRGGADPAGCLWIFDVEARRERLIFDPAEAPGASTDQVSDEERDRRERLRETLTGVTAFGTDRSVRTATFALGGGLWVADLLEGGVRELDIADRPPFDPRPDPTGRRLAYTSGGALRVLDLQSGEDRLIAREEEDAVSWGLAEFVAAEEMGRDRGFWWSPDGDRLLAARVDESRVRVWYISTPEDPTVPARPVRYPQAGADNALVSLSLFDLAGGRVDIDWEPGRFPYLVTVSWASSGPLILLVQSRDQRTWRILSADPVTGTTEVVREDHDDRWLEIVSGVPAWLADGRLVRTVDSEDTRRLVFDDHPVTPPGLQVREVLDVDDQHVMFVATEDPTEAHVWRADSDGTLTRLTVEPGVHTATGGGGVLVLTSAGLGGLSKSRVLKGRYEVATLRSVAEEPVLRAAPTFFTGGRLELRMALFTPGGGEPGGPLPVLLDPYGGPQHARVRKDGIRLLESQWLADQGFAVLVIDGRGTPGRGPAWEREVYRNLADPVLEDQVDGLHAAAQLFPFLDLGRVAIRGWSFGGYLAAMAVLRRPDVFHAAVAGAPETDPALYDTHYQERYLGLPQEEPEAYARSRLIDDAPNLERPLMLVHGLADDNVYVANTLQLSRALMEGGRPHVVLPLSGITHGAIQERVAENLLLLEVDFLRRALGLEAGAP
jgi:dipeptidyl-peptidase 4